MTSARRAAALSAALAGALSAAALLAPALVAAQVGVVTSLPERPREGCEGSRARIYSECGDQRAVLDAALARAADEGKAVLVSAGAEWCVWCHVLDATLKGFVDAQDAEQFPDLYAQADALREATAARFVLVHIEMDRSGTGLPLLEEIGAWDQFEDWIPFVFGVDSAGRFVAKLGERTAETGDYDPETGGMKDVPDPKPLGYDRALLKERILALAAAIEAADATR